MRNLRFLNIIGVSLSATAILIVTLLTVNVEFPELLKWIMFYCFSFLSLFVYDYLDRRGKTNKNVSKNTLVFIKIIINLWVTVPMTIIYILIIKNFFSYLRYAQSLMLLVALFFACLFFVLTFMDRKQNISISD
jgi:hypothetical protein